MANVPFLKAQQEQNKRQGGRIIVRNSFASRRKWWAHLLYETSEPVHVASFILEGRVDDEMPLRGCVTWASSNRVELASEIKLYVHTLSLCDEGGLPTKYSSTRRSFSAD